MPQYTPPTDGVVSFELESYTPTNVGIVDFSLAEANVVTAPKTVRFGHSVVGSFSIVGTVGNNVRIYQL